MKIIFRIYCFLIPSFLFAQSLEINPINAIVESEYTSFELSTGISVSNISETPLEVKISRTIISQVDGSENYFCWNYCNLPVTDTSSSSIVINAGETNDSNLTVHYSPNGYSGETVIQYCAFIDNNPSDSACTYVYFNVDPPYVWLCQDGYCIDTLLYRLGGFSSLEECQANCYSTTYSCINKNCVENTIGTGDFSSLEDCYAFCNLSSINDRSSLPKKIIKTIDLRGQEIEQKLNQLIIYFYDDGSVEKKIMFE